MNSSNKTAAQRNTNERRLMSLIRNHGKIHQAELAKLLNLEKSTVSRIVKKLEKQKLIREAGIVPAGSQGGRQSILLQLDPHGAQAVGVEIGIDEIKFTTINLDGSIDTRKTIPTPKELNPEKIILRLSSELKKIITDLPKSRNLEGVGIGIPGMIDSTKGIVNSSVNLKNWHKVEIVKILENELKVPVLIDNNSRLLTLAEHWYGQGKGCKHFIGLSIGKGIGLGVIADNQLYRGATDQGGNLHNIVDPGGDPCYCGRNGCIEAMAGEKAIINSCRSTQLELENSSDICQALQENRPEVLKMAETTARYLGMTIAHLVDIFDPEKVVINGPMVWSSEFFANAITKHYLLNCFKDLESPPEIVPSKLKESAVCIGAGIIVLQKFFS